MARHEWSPYQLAVFDEVENGKGHVLITARAGCAKTTTIVEAANRLDGNSSILMCAFNKEIANELDRKVLGHVRVSTLHALGFKALQKAWPSVGRIEPNQQKERDVLKKVLKAAYGDAEIRGDLLELTRKAKAFVVDDAKSLENLMTKYDCAPTLDADKLVPRYINWAQEMLAEFRKPSAMITFDDMIYVPAYLKLSTGRYGYVFVDETQDLNPAQFILATGALSSTGRLFFVGDDKQAIYAFRGADANTIPKIREMFSPKELKLTVTYRCPRKIVQIAQNIVPDFQAAPSAPEGVVEHVGDTYMKKNWKTGDFVIARVNAVLVSLCLEALADGIPAYMVGRDIGQGLIKMIEKSKADTIEELVAYTREWQQLETQRAVSSEEDESKINMIADKANSLIRLARDASSIQGLTAFIRGLFDEDKKGDTIQPRIAFMSCHKAKGLENPRVWVIANTFRTGKTQEEDNLYYVAITRAQAELYLVTLPKKGGKEEKLGQ